MRSFVNRILTDQNIQKEMKEIYSYYRDENIISAESLLEVVDNYAEQLDQSQKLNFLRWPILNQKIHANPVIHESYEAEVENVKNYIKNRILWMDKKLNYTPKPEEPETSINAVATNELKIRTVENTLFIENVTGFGYLKVMDITGKTIVNDKIIDSNYQITLPKGIYLLLITTNQQGTSTHKCIIP